MSVAAPRPGAAARGTVRLMERDRVLLACVGLARCLTTAQIARLVFPNTKLKGIQRRLRWLAAEGSERAAPHPLLVRRQFPLDVDGPEGLRRRAPAGRDAAPAPVATMETAWFLTPAGYVVASTALGRPLAAPLAELKAAFLAHTLATNELLCGLLPSSAGTLPRPRALPFEWLVSHSAQLPWREYDRTAGQYVGRVIAPDAILEVRGAGRRVFIEMEMGTHSVRANPSKPGNTLGKLERYEKFVASFVGDTSGPTFYQERFGDELKPSLLFIVTSDVRREAVRRAIGARPVGAAARGLDVQVLTIPEAIAWARQLVYGERSSGVAASVSVTGAAAADTVLSAEDFELLVGFYSDAVALVKRLGNDADPPSRRKVKAFLARVDPRRPTPSPKSAGAGKGARP